MRSGDFGVESRVGERFPHAIGRIAVGVVEHAQSGERRYLTELSSIVDFIAPYVRAMEEQDDGQGRRLARLRQLWRRDGASSD